jgi:hypothetical protein
MNKSLYNFSICLDILEISIAIVVIDLSDAEDV